MPKRMRICHVIHSLGPGGAESVLVDLATVAPSAGLELSVVSLSAAEDQVHVTRLRALGVPVTELEAQSRWDPRGPAVGIQQIAAQRPDVVHSHLKHADLVGAAAAARLGVPLVSTLHLIEDTVTPLGRGRRWLAAQARVRRAAATVAVSDALHRWYVQTFRVDPARVRTIHNGIVQPAVDPAARSRVRAELGLSPTAVVAVQVALMRPGKGHAELLEAAGKVGGDVRFLLVGDGPLRPELEARAAGLPPGLVTFAGYRTDVADLVAAADLVVHPSHFDALPTALLTALGVGRPVVASAVGGIPEIITPEVGVLVPPADVLALATAVATLAADPSARRRFGGAAERRFAAEFEAGRWAGRLRDLYDEVQIPCVRSA